MKNNSPITRFLAVLALAISVVLVIVVVSGAGSDDGDKSNSNKVSKSKNRQANQKPKKRVYQVKDGDTLTGISDKTGVPMDQLESLNPEIDPQALIAGQKLKLR